jgi:chloramphenicol O-acetyltransferase type A
MKIIDLASWDRAIHYNFFKNMDYPQYNICMNIDVTHFLNAVKSRKLSFYYAMIYLATYAANETEELRYRIRDNQVILHDRIHPSFTELTEGDKYFKIVTVDMADSLEKFISEAKKKSENQKEYFPMNDMAGRDDLVYITCLPWISFTHISHTINMNKNDCVPRISWGKYFPENGKVMLPFSVQVHHSFADGVHVAKYVERLQELLNSFE